MRKIILILILTSINAYTENEKYIIDNYIHQNEDYIAKQIDIIEKIENVYIVKVISEENWFEYLYIFDFSNTNKKPNVKKIDADEIIDSVNIIELGNIGKVTETVSHTHSGNGFIKLTDITGREVFKARFYDSHYENQSFILYEGKYKDDIQKFFKDADSKYISKIFDKDNGYRLNIKYNYDKDNGILIYGRILYMLSNEDESEIKNVYYEDIKEHYTFDRTKKIFSLSNTFILSSAVNIRLDQDAKPVTESKEYKKYNIKSILKIIEVLIFIAVVILSVIILIYTISSLLKTKAYKEENENKEKNKKIALKIIKDLITKGINAVTSEDIEIGFNIWTKGSTALMFASYYDYRNIVALLIENLCDVNKKNYEGETALMFACRRCNTEIVKMLIDAKADVNIKDNCSQNALIHLVFSMPDGQKAKEIASILIKNGIDIHVKTEEKENAIIISSLDKNLTDVSKMLIDLNIDIHAKDESGVTALMNAAMNKNNEIIETLIRRGCDINAKDDSGYTALILAATYGHADVVKLLIKSWADVNIKSNEEKTALDYAKENGNREIIDMLIALGAK